MRDEDEALFSGRGSLPEDLARLERALSQLPLPPEPDWSARPRAERRPPVFAWAAAAAVLVIASAALLLLGRDATDEDQPDERRHDRSRDDGCWQ